MVKAETLETDEVNSENDYEVTEMQWQMEKVRRKMLAPTLKQMKRF